MASRAVQDEGPVGGQLVRAVGEFAERDVQGGADEAVRLALPAGAHVHDDRRPLAREGAAQVCGGEPAGGGDLGGQRFQGVLGAAQVADDPVESDPGEAGDDLLSRFCGVKTTSSAAGWRTVPACSAKRPSAGTFSAPRRCPAAHSCGSRASTTTAPADRSPVNSASAGGRGPNCRSGPGPCGSARRRTRSSPARPTRPRHPRPRLSPAHRGGRRFCRTGNMSGPSRARGTTVGS